MKNQIGIYNHTTGETIVREMTTDEQEQRDAEIVAWLAAKESKSQAEAELSAKKAAAEAKLGALGLTTDDLKALGLG